MKIYYDPANKEKSRDLRNNSTLSEVLLWKELKGKKALGYQFTRQKPIGHYIVDFYCSKLRLAIEIDGHSHDEKLDQDLLRQNEIEKLGIKFLRFEDIDVKVNLQGVLKMIEEYIHNNPLAPFNKEE